MFPRDNDPVDNPGVIQLSWTWANIWEEIYSPNLTELERSCREDPQIQNKVDPTEADWRLQLLSEVLQLAFESRLWTLITNTSKMQFSLCHSGVLGQCKRILKNKERVQNIAAKAGLGFGFSCCDRKKRASTVSKRELTECWRAPLRGFQKLTCIFKFAKATCWDVIYAWINDCFVNQQTTWHPGWSSDM